jgi:hypothetical protein
MSAPFQGLNEAMARFRADVGAALGRGQRAAAEAGERNAAFKGRTRELADKVRAREVRPEAAELTSEGMRRSAASFRSDNGLPVERLPEGAELLGPAPGEQRQPTTFGAVRPPAPGGRRLRPSDDDEDFSQEEILYRG